MVKASRSWIFDRTASSRRPLPLRRPSFGPSSRRAPATTTSADFSLHPSTRGVALSGTRRGLPGPGAPTKSPAPAGLLVFLSRTLVGLRSGLCDGCLRLDDSGRTVGRADDQKADAYDQRDSEQQGCHRPWLPDHIIINTIINTRGFPRREIVDWNVRIHLRRSIGLGHGHSPFVVRATSPRPGSAPMI